MPEPAEFSLEDLTLVVEALEDAMFFRDARSRIPKMSADARRRDKDRVAAYQALAGRLKKPPR